MKNWSGWKKHRPRYIFWQNWLYNRNERIKALTKTAVSIHHLFKRVPSVAVQPIVNGVPKSCDLYYNYGDKPPITFTPTMKSLIQRTMGCHYMTSPMVDIIYLVPRETLDIHNSIRFLMPHVIQRYRIITARRGKPNRGFLQVVR